MSDEQLLLAATVCAALLAGVLLRLPSCLSRPLAAHFNVSASRARVYTAVFQFLLVPMMLAGGLLLDKWGPQAVLIVSVLLAGIGTGGLEFAHSRRYLVPAYGALAAAGAGVTLGSIALMPAAFLPERQVASANLGFVALGLGFLAAPGLARLMEGQFGFRRSLQLFALLCLVPALPAMLAASSAFPAAADTSRNVLADPRLWLAALLALMYQPLEASISSWTPGMLKEMGCPQPGPTLWWSFWGVFLGSRLLVAAFIRTGPAPWFLLLLALLAAITLGNLLGGYRSANGSPGLLMVGLCFGPIYPTIIGLVLQMFPARPGAALGVVLGSAALGGLCFPPLMDLYAQRTSARKALFIPLAFAVVMMAPALVLALIQGL